jgi:hypothetical protein
MDEAPDPEQYEAHVELCRQVPGGIFRHGQVFGSPRGEAPHAYYAEWEFADRAAFDHAAKSDEFMATGKDAHRLGLKTTIEFVELD